MFESYNDVVNDKNKEKCSSISLYYLPQKTIYNNLKKFKAALNKYKNKKYINIANEVLKRLMKIVNKFFIIDLFYRNLYNNLLLMDFGILQM